MSGSLRTRCIAILVALAVAGGCTVTDTGNPPLGPEIDPAGIGAFSMFGGVVQVSGAPGTIWPAEGEVELRNLDSDEEPVRVRVVDDGSFSLTILAEVSDVGRLQVSAESGRSRPLDLALSSGAALEPSAPWSCITGLPLEVDVREPVSVSVTNECDEDVTFAAPRLRRPLDALEVRWEPGTVSAGATAALEIERPLAGPVDRVVLLDASLSERSPDTGGRAALTARALD